MFSRDCKKCKNKGWVDDDMNRPGAKSIWQYCTCRHGKQLRRVHGVVNRGEVRPWWRFW